MTRPSAIGSTLNGADAHLHNIVRFLSRWLNLEPREYIHDNNIIITYK